MAATSAPSSVYDFEALSIDGKPAHLSTQRGKVMLIVNTASQCGFTPQFGGLEVLWEKYRDKGLVVLGFPSNEFGAQEPGSPQDILSFCSMRYGVTFPLFSKIETRPSSSQSPVYALLSTQTGELPTWNFGKYVVGRDGKARRFFGASTRPDDPSLLAEIERALASPSSD